MVDQGISCDAVAPSSVGAYTTVSVHDDVPPGQPRIGQGPPDDKASRSVDQELGVAVYQPRGDDNLDDLLYYLLRELTLLHALVMLGRHKHCVHTHGLAVDVFHRHLRLSIRSQMRDNP